MGRRRAAGCSHGFITDLCGIGRTYAKRVCYINIIIYTHTHTRARVSVIHVRSLLYCTRTAHTLAAISHAGVSQRKNTARNTIYINNNNIYIYNHHLYNIYIYNDLTLLIRFEKQALLAFFLIAARIVFHPARGYGPRPGRPVGKPLRVRPVLRYLT